MNDILKLTTAGMNPTVYQVLRVLHRSKLNTIIQAFAQERNCIVVIKIAHHACKSIQRHDMACYNLAFEEGMLSLLKSYGIRAPRPIRFAHLDDQACLVMHHIPGRTLEELAKQGHLNIYQIASIIDDVAAILQRVHGLGYLHHDVKPSNIMVLPSGRAILIDWGSATHWRPMNERSAYVAWTPGFASHEQMSGHMIRANDIYALGKTIQAVCTKLIPELAYIVESATASLNQRYPSLTELREDLVPFLWPTWRAVLAERMQAG